MHKTSNLEGLNEATAIRFFRDCMETEKEKVRKQLLDDSGEGEIYINFIFQLTDRMGLSHDAICD